MDHERREILQAGFDDFVAKPFRLEDIAVSLAHLLGVVYEYVCEEIPAEEAVNWSQVVLDEKLVARMQEAAELFSVTDIEACLREMEQLSGEPRQLAAHLRQLRQHHDMRSILEVLREMQHVPR
ncbi:MAG: hypothetical protein ETSY2_26500 [Candidatus Entotheonella gemina]|uniref:Response regulatory domain-containing protein n=1 Tax=Candidatus Entotheonella gemina TaxID=1429439 RepID=W4M3E4_9BACT|nr:MAG: hypothetical protein ETSY2_26500 [Candidatus Entotheonella gemina]